MRRGKSWDELLAKKKVRDAPSCPRSIDRLRRDRETVHPREEKE